MSLIKIQAVSPDPILKAAPYAEGEIARIAHINYLIDQLNETVGGAFVNQTTIAPFGTVTPLTAIPASFADETAARSAVNTLRTDVEARLEALEAKVNLMVAALQA